MGDVYKFIVNVTNDELYNLRTSEHRYTTPTRARAHTHTNTLIPKEIIQLNCGCKEE